MALQHLRSSTADKRPTPGAMSDGQLAMNTNLVSPGLFLKDSNGDLVKVGPVHVGTTAPNATPGAGGQAGNSKGEQWLDTSSSRYVFKIWDGTAWRTEDGEFVNVSGDTMTGALGIIAGTAAAPGVFFSGDTNTGIYSPGADQVAISTNGTRAASIDSDGKLIVGKTPYYLNAGNSLYFGSNSTSTAFTDTSFENTVFGYNALTGFTGTGYTGNTAIGHGALRYITTGAYNTCIGRAAGTAITAGGSNLCLGNSAGSSITTGGNNVIIGNIAGTASLANTVIIGDGAGNERLRVDSSGRLGLGTSSPSEILDCKGNIILGAQNAASATLQPTSGSGTDIAGSNLVLRSGRSTGSGSGGQIQILPSPSSTASGTTLRGDGSNGFYMRLSPTSWADHPTLGLLTVALGTGISEGNRSGLSGDSTVLTIDGCDTSSQAALEIVGTSNGGGGDQGFIRFFGSASKNPYATIVAVTPGVDYTSGNLAIRTYNAGVENTVATFTNTGRLGIGTTSPAAILHTSGGYVYSQNGAGNPALIDLAANGGAPLTSSFTVAQESTGVAALFNRANAALYFATNGTERARIDSSGRLLVGTSTARDKFNNASGETPNVQIEGTGTTASGLYMLSMTANNTSSSAAAGPVMFFGRSEGATTGSYTVVSADKNLGRISFQGADGTEFVEAAKIDCFVDGTPGANDMPGRLVFSTTADGASSPTERARITSNGTLILKGGTADVSLEVSNNSRYWNHNIDGSTISGFTYYIFQRGGSSQGSITYNGAGVSYNTTSDYRAKENVTILDGALAKISLLKVYRFNFINNPSQTVDGFLAHEAQAVVPECVTGEKDAVDDDGNPVYQGIDQSKLVPLLTAALQEALAEIKSLKARLDAAGI